MFILGLLLFGGALFLLGVLVMQAYVRSLGWEQRKGLTYDDLPKVVDEMMGDGHR